MSVWSDERMDSSDFLAALVRDGNAFRVAAASAPLNAQVPSCPGWTNADLVAHLSEVHYFWAAVVTDRVTGWAQVSRAERAPDAELLSRYDETFARVMEVLAATDPATQVWTWSEQQDAAFVIRRMAQETAIHCWDAALTAGRQVSVDAQLASDGIDEFLQHFLPNVAVGAEPVAGSVHIHCGDTPGEWTIRPAAEGYDITREHAKGDCALRGDASNLLLVLWRRLGPGAIDVVGDTGVAERFLAATNLD